jgi:hypothetical protein
LDYFQRNYKDLNLHILPVTGQYSNVSVPFFPNNFTASCTSFLIKELFTLYSL